MRSAGEERLQRAEDVENVGPESQVTMSGNTIVGCGDVRFGLNGQDRTQEETCLEMIKI